MSKDRAIFYIVLAIEILTVVLTSIGVLEKEAVLIMTGLLIFYFIFSKIEDSLILFIISIPLFIALPIGNFDSMANWRILLTVLFLVWLFQRKWWKVVLGNIMKLFHRRPLISPLAKLIVLFLGIGALSLFIATDIVVGIKKILFLINIFLLFVIVQDIGRDRIERLRIIKTGAMAGIISLIVGYSQLVSIFFKPLYTFWQWWAYKVIPVFYGSRLSELLATSNTWFSYYENSPPTLRMFSVFPDSHSFALFMIISLIFFSYLLFRKNRIYWVVIILSFLVLIFSGSRGIWVSAVVPFLGIIFLALFRKIKNYRYRIPIINSHSIRLFISFLLVFLIAFPISSLIMSQSYQGTDSTLAFKRAKSIIDLEELSVKSRMGIWKASFQSILKRPILGVGIGNYPVVLDEDISAAKKGASAHNLYLDVASEMGLLGLIILLLIFWQILKKGWKTNLIFVFFLLWIFIYNLFDVVLLNDKVLLLFMVALAILYDKE